MSHFPIKRPPLEPIALEPLAKNPLVSIIVPSYNQGRFIRATIDSILEQDYRPLKIHVIDGGSSDETVDVLKSYGDIPELSWVSEPDAGVVEAVNKGFALVEGDIIGIQSSDDRYLHGAIQRAVDQFLGHAATGLIYGDTVKIDEHGQELTRYRIGPWSLDNLFLLKTWIPQPSCFFRRELLDTCGGWNEGIPYAPDTDLWIRMAFRTQVRKIDEYLSERRMHEEQRDTQAARILGDYRKMITQSPDITAAPKDLRKAARAGCELLYRRYNPSGSHWRALWHDLRAVLICPKAFDGRRWRSNGVIIPLRILLQPLAGVKRWLGCWLHERWRTEVALSDSLSRLLGIQWVDLCNRHESAVVGDAPDARVVETEYTSYLTVARLFPRVGGRLAQKCVAEHPLSPLPADCVKKTDHPRVSVIIPVGGEDRLANFQLVLNSLLHQSEGNLEVIVLEHSPCALYGKQLPEGVVYQRFEMEIAGEEFNKSRLFNIGVEKSQAPIVMLHDADILVSKDYIETAISHLENGVEAIRPLRFLFYLTEDATTHLCAHHRLTPKLDIENVAQNSQGGSVLMLKEVYQQIGGHDERFQGWGGEDLEFLERLRTRKLFRGGMMPAFHLWHPPAEKKANKSGNLELLNRLRKVVPVDRVSLLRTRNSGVSHLERQVS